MNIVEKGLVKFAPMVMCKGEKEKSWWTLFQKSNGSIDKIVVWQHGRKSKQLYVHSWDQQTWRWWKLHLKLKVKALLKRENMWDIVETKTILDSFLTTIGGLNFIEQQFKQLKNNALSMKDDLVNILVKHNIMLVHGRCWKICFK